jgi:cysteine synthase
MTPLLEVTDLGFTNGNRVFAKCENRSLVSHSHYDRIYEQLLDRLPAEVYRDRKSYHLLDTSSGNAGTAFSRFLDLYGLQGTVVFPRSVRSRRLECSRSKTVNVLRSDYADYMQGALKTLLEIRRDLKRDGKKPYYVNHSQDWQSVVAMKSCGEEIVSQMEDLGLTTDVYISALGNGSSTTGINIPLRKWNPNLRTVGFEPKRSPVFHNFLKNASDQKYEETKLTGTGVWGTRFPNMGLHLVNEIALLDETPEFTRKIFDYVSDVQEQFRESIGITSAAAIHTAKKMSEHTKNKIYMIIFYDISEYYDELIA